MKESHYADCNCTECRESRSKARLDWLYSEEGRQSVWADTGGKMWNGRYHHPECDCRWCGGT